MSSTNKVLLALVALVVFGIAAPIVRADVCTPVVGNLVVNCGFETGTFASWTQTGNPGFTTVTAGAANSGAFGASFGPVTTLGFIDQNIATVAGGTYSVSFFLRNLSGSPPNEFQFLWNGAIQQDLINSAAFAYTQFTFSLVATGALSNIKFGFRHDPNFWNFDDVVAVRSVPEPATMLLLGSGIAGMAMKLRRRRASSTS